MATAVDVADWFLAVIDREAGDSITHLKLQKLVYYAQAWSLALRGVPLFDEDMRAWAHGPVAESVWNKYRGNRWDALPHPGYIPELPDEDADFIGEVLDVYGDFSAKHLEEMTHRELPWIEARGSLPPEERSNTPISKRTMSDFYKKMYEEHGEG